MKTYTYTNEHGTWIAAEVNGRWTLGCPVMFKDPVVRFFREKRTGCIYKFVDNMPASPFQWEEVTADDYDHQIAVAYAQYLSK